MISELAVPKICIGNHFQMFTKKIAYVPLIEYRLYKICRRFSPDVAIESGSFYLMHVSKILDFKSYYMCDTETAFLINPMSRYLSQKIFTPYIYKKNLGPNQIRYRGMQELAYLHPDEFSPNLELLKKLKIGKNEKIITFRLVSWDATHDSSLSNPIDSLRHSKIKELS